MLMRASKLGLAATAIAVLGPTACGIGPARSARVNACTAVSACQENYIFL